MHTSAPILAMWVPGTWELLIILAIGLLLFGRRLPEVGRSLGKSIVEFKKGIKGMEDEIDQASSPKRIESEPSDAYSTEPRAVPHTDSAGGPPETAGGESPSHKPA